MRQEAMMMKSKDHAGMESPGGLDPIIARVDSYMKNPKLVTPETLQELKMELEDLKSYMDEEESGEAGGSAPDEGEKDYPNGLTVMIGKLRRKK